MYTDNNNNANASLKNCILSWFSNSTGFSIVLDKIVGIANPIIAKKIIVD